MNIILLLISLVIYLTLSIPGFIYISFGIITSYIGARYLHTKYGKGILITLISIYSLVLITLKLLGNFDNLVIPIGISYYTLQVISYLVDVYKGDKYEKNFILYALYIAYIPHLFIGPITKYSDIREKLQEKRKFKLDSIIDGFLRISFGLFKKFVIANRISLVISTITSDVNVYGGCYAILAMLLYSIMIYTDFSGGIDIVLGITKILGIDLKENFNSPYQAESMKDFWRRWHISLGTWLKEYIYIPLGGNRCSKFRKNINVLITFVVSGLWHGVNYLVWGLINGILVMLGDDYKTPNKYLNRVINFIIVSLLWSFFIWDNNLEALRMIMSIFTNFNIKEVASNILNLGLSLGEWIILIIAVIILVILDIKKVMDKVRGLSCSKKFILALLLILVCLVIGIYGIGFNVSDFIYSKF